VPISAPEPLLEIRGLSAGYGKIACCRASTCRWAKARSWRCWPHGAGKTTLLKAVSGLLPRTGNIRFAGKDMSSAGPRDTVREGLVHVVEGHRVFTQLTVFDNLLLAGYGMPRAELATRVEEALAFFPDRRQAGRPRHHPLGRPAANAGRGAGPGATAAPTDAGRTLGRLSPVLVDRVLAAAARLREAGTAVLLVEQLIEKALALADRVYALARGSIVLQARTDEPICPTVWSTPISGRMSVRRWRGDGSRHLVGDVPGDLPLPVRLLAEHIEAGFRVSTVFDEPADASLSVHTRRTTARSPDTMISLISSE